MGIRMINGTKRVIVTQHQGCTIYWDSLGEVLEHLEMLLPECEEGAEFRISIANVTPDAFKKLLDFDGY